jgi:hypothetical protein
MSCLFIQNMAQRAARMTRDAAWLMHGGRV